jgi:predicted phosphoribosyltransferase
VGKLSVLSYSDEPFADRKEAGRALASALKWLIGEDIVVLGIPRGGMVIANEIARALGSELDIVLSRKIGAMLNGSARVSSWRSKCAAIFSGSIRRKFL